MTQQRYDYIVVGGGSAGCVAAMRLAQSSDAQVLLLESGPAGSSLIVRTPIGFAHLIGEGKHNWNYHSEEEPGLAGRRIALPRGRLMGGCSAINGMVYIRGQRQDYDNWALAGNEGWSYEDVLPVFKRSERHWAGASSYHGGDGPLEVNQVSAKLPVTEAFIEAANQAGIPTNSDFNGARQEGVGYFDSNITDGRRVTSASAFLAPGKQPGNLRIVNNFDVHRIDFDGTRAQGVTGCYRNAGAESVEFTADGEIILSAGAMNSPKLLELSGIGAAERLQSLGIAPTVNLPGVGENLQDHCNNYLFYSTRDCQTYYDFTTPWRAPITLLQYIFRRSGIFANPAALVGAFTRIDDDADRPDAQIHFAAGASQTLDNGTLKSIPGVCASICRLRPASRGSVHISCNDPSQPPRIQGGYLRQQEDLEFQLSAVKRLREIFSQPALQPLIAEELPPLGECQSDEALLRGIPSHAESVHHPAGTCRMGSDESAVVTPDLRVIGTEGLRVADASIMPTLVSGNTHAACVMIAEKVAEAVLE